MQPVPKEKVVKPAKTANIVSIARKMMAHVACVNERQTADGNEQWAMGNGVLLNDEPFSCVVTPNSVRKVNRTVRSFDNAFFREIALALLFCFILHPLTAQVTVCSWNIQDLGKSKTDETIAFIANTVKGFDIVCIQEVVAGYGGTQAVARLADELNRKGAKWDYRTSEPTSGENSYKRERYAFLWKLSKVKLTGQPWLEILYTDEINREPFFATFEFHGKPFTLVNFHAITKSMQPETEIKYFRFLPAEYPENNLIFVGDFNCPQSHTVFNPLKSMGYKPIFTGKKTSLKQECVSENCLASEFDNVLYDTSKIQLIGSGTLLFYESFHTLKAARLISDHIPIWFQFSIN